ncbi:MAG: hypothetical protein HKP59_10585 [Lutibacter sp.]|uniref:hypothetical protein n=1 Tax=Lutibacter sp. TaxID=1925666 RepID=UPI0017D6E8AD|nr:hypothetical protein [Lutibacter sp.]MBT8318059.1 hypothetical protein [Lutibacter sp.]NNJ58919.1 hypothetical protein [Lutibacter sp.]
MRILINPKQLSLLTSHFHIVEGHGLIENKENLILEGRTPEYLVSLWISSYPAEIRIGTNMGSGGAMAIARKLFPSSRVFSAKKA